MLPRVSAALAKNLAPLSAKQDSGAFQKYKHQQKQERPPKQEEPALPNAQAPAQPAVAQPKLRVIKGASKPWEGESESQEAAPPPAERPKPVGTAEVFLHLFQFIHLRKQQLMRWLGFASYRQILAGGLSSRSKKRGVKLRKGTMIDHKAE